ncbi:MAG: cupin domain-containing protein [candidate division Zixibacteria bacterium]|nr:cupin domain-containing protein [candidate division Zixibacteria bacterium]MDD5425860.1 cupin domain-containing protein [candidate division Zixibacteria bacterium]
MPVYKYRDMQSVEVKMDGVKSASKAVVIGKREGWADYVLRVFRLEPGGYTPRHRHAWEHINHVIRGRGKLRLGDQIFELGEKDFALVPANTEHQFENPFDTPFEFICIVPEKGEY